MTQAPEYGSKYGSTRHIGHGTGHVGCSVPQDLKPGPPEEQQALLCHWHPAPLARRSSLLSLPPCPSMCEQHRPRTLCCAGPEDDLTAQAVAGCAKLADAPWPHVDAVIIIIDGRTSYRANAAGFPLQIAGCDTLPGHSYTVVARLEAQIQVLLHKHLEQLCTAEPSPRLSLLSQGASSNDSSTAAQSPQMIWGCEAAHLNKNLHAKVCRLHLPAGAIC